MSTLTAPAAQSVPPSPAPFVTPIQALAAARCLDLEGRSVRLRDAFGGKPTVLALVRQFGCLFCHELVSELIAESDRLLAAGGHVVIVGPGSLEQATKFARYRGLPREGIALLADPERASFEGAQLPRSWVMTFLHPGAWDAHARAKDKGHRITGAHGDVPQLGGVFVVRPPAELVYEHRARFAGDHPTVEELVRQVELARRR